MGKEWFKGHYDFGWRNAHKEPGYYGFGVLIQRHWPRYWDWMTVH